MWIKIEDELPMKGFGVKVKNGKSIVDHALYHKKSKEWSCSWDNHQFPYDGRDEYIEKVLHKVTHWWKCPVMYPKIPAKDLEAYLSRAKKLRKQMQKREMTWEGGTTGINRPLPESVVSNSPVTI